MFELHMIFLKKLFQISIQKSNLTYFQKNMPINTCRFFIVRSGKVFYATDAKYIQNTKSNKIPVRLSKKLTKKSNKNGSINSILNRKIKNKKMNHVFGVNVKRKLSKNNKLKEDVSGAKHKQKKIALHTATKRLHCFSRRGNQPRREKFFGKYIEGRAITYAKSKKTPLIVYLPKFYHAVTPFMRLKTRRKRRGRRSRRNRKNIPQKVTYLFRNAGERQSYLFFSKNLQKNMKTNKKFAFRDQIQTQRESLFSKTRRRIPKKKFRSGNRQTKGVNTNRATIKTLRDFRDELHKRAYRIKPRYWRRKKYLKLLKLQRKKKKKRKKRRLLALKNF